LAAPLLPASHPSPQEQAQQKEEKQEKVKKPPVITEEILVVGEAPQDRPVSTVTTLTETQVERIKPLDLSEAIRYAPGVLVTFGDKSVYTLKLRGVDSKRIALLVDGIPVYEPYYSSFDLKTVAAYGVDSLQLTKGPSSVLYGPNTLGGIVNVITQRPEGRPQLSLNASYGQENTRSLGLQSGLQWDRLAFSGSLLYQDSDGFQYPDPDSGDQTERGNSDYQRFNLNTKVYWNPTNSSEILFNGGIFLSDYGMPPGLTTSRPRYWRFKKWNRYTLNAGGYTALGKNSLARFRAYYVNYNNTLAMFSDADLSQQRFESTHDNSVYGFFGMADLAAGTNNNLKFSFDYKGDDVHTQDDVGESWNAYDQLTVSFGVEDHFQFLPDWQVVAGLSYDYLDKFTGEGTGKVNPLLGLKYSPLDSLKLHLSFSQKSRFPSMRSMYSSSSGNPDLISERGTIWELGFTYNREVFLSGAVFFMNFKDMIDSVRLPEFDFERRYFNIGEAYINGFELQAQKDLRHAGFVLNYTFLDHKNNTDNQPLQLISQHNLNFDVQIYPFTGIRLGLFGSWGSRSYALIYEGDPLEEVPAYFYLDSVLAYTWRRMEIFLKVTNIFDDHIYTEPGFPWRGRYIELGFRTSILD
jgi:iron complex outermembrane receptor protein